MVAYSFRPRFVAPIIAGTKTQTIRADRVRHARAGEEVQLYTGMRTKHCRIIGKATCMAVSPIRINFKLETIAIGARGLIQKLGALDTFARSDGFEDFLDMREFWRREHGLTRVWDGIIIEWKGFRNGDC